jgi:hypothetical protein
VVDVRGYNRAPSLPQMSRIATGTLEADWQMNE